MQPQRPKFCGPYQAARKVKGRPMCIHTRHSCPLGLHACQLCHKEGHGAEDCRTRRAAPFVVPPRPTSAPREPFISPTSKAVSMRTSRACSRLLRPGVGVDSTTLPSPPAVPAPSISPDLVQPTSSSVFVPGIGRKGEGKTENYGVAIASPTVVAQAELPFDLQQPGSASGLHVTDVPPSEPLIPPPLAATTELIEHWISTIFQKLTDISTKEPAEVGETILWRGVKSGRRGHQSTAVEHFHGKVRHVAVGSDAELYFYID